MKINITIPDEQIPQLRELALTATREEGRTISVTTLCAQYVLAALASELEADGEGGDLPTVATRARSVSQREADARILPPVEQLLQPVQRPPVGSLGGATDDEQTLLTRTMESMRRKREAAGLDPATGVPTEALATRAAVQGTGPRPMGFLREATASRRLDPGPVSKGVPEDCTPFA